MRNKFSKLAIALVLTLVLIPQGSVLSVFQTSSKVAGSSLSTATFDFQVDYELQKEDSQTYKKELNIENVGTIDARYRVKVDNLDEKGCQGITFSINSDDFDLFEEVIYEDFLDKSNEKSLTLKIKGDESNQTCSFSLKIEGAQKGLYYNEGFTYSKEIEVELNFEKELSQVVINEVYYQLTGDESPGNSPDATDRWIEIYNPSDKTVDLSGWKFKNNSIERTLKGNVEIEPYQFLIFSHNSSLCSPQAWDCDNQIHHNLGEKPSDDWLSGGDLHLKDGNQNIIDNVYLKDSVDAEKSYARIPDGEDDWQESCPTPGEKNKEDNCQNLNQQIQTESSPQEIQTDNIEEDKVDEKEDLKDDSDKDDHQDDPSKEEENKEEEKKENEEKVDLQEFSRSISQTEEESKETGSKEDPQSVEAVDLKEEEPEELKDKEKEAEETEKREAVNIKETEEETEGEKLNDDQNE